MVRGLDALTSLTLKHVRERWWNDAFAEFLEGALKPKPGKRIVDVGCGVGTAEISLARLQVSQLRLFGVDLMADRVREALNRVRGINARAGFASADATRLPFVDGVFDCTFCVAVLQHVRDVPMALAEFARVTRPGGRVLAVEPDNANRYWLQLAFRQAWKRSNWAADFSPRWRSRAAKRRRPPSVPRCLVCFRQPALRRSPSILFPSPARTSAHPRPRCGRHARK